MPFDFEFMRVKSEKYGLQKMEIDYLYKIKPTIDLKPILIMVNRGSFLGYDKVWKSSLEARGLRNELVPRWYESKQYDKIIEYVNAERDALLHPVDFVVFDGLESKEDLRRIVFLSKAVDNEQLNGLRNSIEKTVEEKRYNWQVARVSIDGRIEMTES